MTLIAILVLLRLTLPLGGINVWLLSAGTNARQNENQKPDCERKSHKSFSNIMVSTIFAFHRYLTSHGPIVQTEGIGGVHWSLTSMKFDQAVGNFAAECGEIAAKGC